VTPEPEADEVEELAKAIRRLIESNRLFLERVNDEQYEDEDAEPGSEPVAEDYEEL